MGAWGIHPQMYTEDGYNQVTVSPYSDRMERKHFPLSSWQSPLPWLHDTALE